MSKKTEESKKTCFIIMPISDQEGYENGHFNRVYEHIIKPACVKSDFIPMRADEQNKTNYIVIDILKRILECDILLCDLSGKNPNVMYELGIRQAFNKKTLLIKDKRTDKIFDIQGLRYTEYNETLRVDSVQSNITEISKGLVETLEAEESEVNSLIQLLSIKPASLKNTVELSEETSVILQAIEGINNRISNLERPKSANKISRSIIFPKPTSLPLSNGDTLYLGQPVYFSKNGDRKYEELGVLRDIGNNYIRIEGSETYEIPMNEISGDNFGSVPF